MILTMRDFRRVKACSRGSRAFFAKHGFDWTSFLKNGIESEELLKTNDAMIKQIVDAAIKAQEEENGQK